MSTTLSYQQLRAIADARKLLELHGYQVTPPTGNQHITQQGWDYTLVRKYTPQGTIAEPALRDL